MEDFKRKKNIKKKVYSRTSFFVLLVISIFLLKGAYGVLQKQIESKENLAHVEQRLLEAQERKNELSSSIQHLQTEAGIEKEIRNKFDVSRPGEEVIVIIDSKNSESDIELENQSVYERVSQWIKGLF